MELSIYSRSFKVRTLIFSVHTPPPHSNVLYPLNRENFGDFGLLAVAVYFSAGGMKFGALVMFADNIQDAS